MNIIDNKKIYFTISGVLVVVSLFSIFMWGIQLGIDFKGGTLIEVEYGATRPDIRTIEALIAEFSLGDVRIQEAGEKGIIIRTRTLDNIEHISLLSSLKTGDETLFEKRFTSVGPILGEELKNKAITALIITTIVIVLFIAYAFRHISDSVKSWKYGIAAILALLHDVIIPTGMLSALGKFYGVEADALFITALLAILGLSINDTIVVFDRIRENLKNKISKNFIDTVNISLNQTITRSVNTSVTTLLALVSLFFFGPESTRIFSLVLIVGLVVGTYSSIFIASPLLIILQNKKNR